MTTHNQPTEATSTFGEVTPAAASTTDQAEPDKRAAYPQRPVDSVDRDDQSRTRSADFGDRRGAARRDRQCVVEFYPTCRGADCTH